MSTRRVVSTPPRNAARATGAITSPAVGSMGSAWGQGQRKFCISLEQRQTPAPDVRAFADRVRRPCFRLVKVSARLEAVE